MIVSRGWRACERSALLWPRTRASALLIYRVGSTPAAIAHRIRSDDVVPAAAGNKFDSSSIGLLSAGLVRNSTIEHLSMIGMHPCVRPRMDEGLLLKARVQARSSTTATIRFWRASRTCR